MDGVSNAHFSKVVAACPCRITSLNSEDTTKSSPGTSMFAVGHGRSTTCTVTNMMTRLHFWLRAYLPMFGLLSPQLSASVNRACLSIFDVWREDIIWGDQRFVLAELIDVFFSFSCAFPLRERQTPFRHLKYYLCTGYAQRSEVGLFYLLTHQLLICCSLIPATLLHTGGRWYIFLIAKVGIVICALLCEYDWE